MTARVHSSTPLRLVGFDPRQKSLCGTKRARRSKDGSASPPHDLLWAEVSDIWPEAQREHAPGINGRKFRIDIAFPDERVAIEVDGFAFHGRHLGVFNTDRERGNLLTQHGWLILHYTIRRIRNDMFSVLAEIHETLERVRHDG